MLLSFIVSSVQDRLRVLRSVETLRSVNEPTARMKPGQAHGRPLRVTSLWTAAVFGLWFGTDREQQPLRPTDLLLLRLIDIDLFNVQKKISDLEWGSKNGSITRNIRAVISTSSRYSLLYWDHSRV